MRAVLYGMAAVMALAAIAAAIGLRRGIHAAPDSVPVPQPAARGEHGAEAAPPG
jgi:hypothetical protein